MKRGRIRRRKKIDSFQIKIGLLLTLSVPAFLLGIRHAVSLIQPISEDLLILSVMSDAPMQSWELLERRFHSDMIPPNEIHSNSSDKIEAETEKPKAEPPETEQPAYSAPKPPPPKEIPAEYRGPLIEKNMAGYENGSFIPCGNGYLRNDTELNAETIKDILSQPPRIQALKTKEPQVLIFHTHATESYEPYDSEYYDTRGTWRSTDNTQNMVEVGNALASALEAKGIAVLHSDVQHDYPSYNGSYNRSAETVAEYLKKYPSIKVVLDVHRDATQSGDEIIKPVTTINGKKAAQVMIIAPCDDGTMDLPNWRENLRFAGALQNAIESKYPTLTRPIFFCYRKYNMHLSTGALLLEVGSHGNTLEEAVYTAQMIGECLGDYLNSTMKK